MTLIPVELRPLLPRTRRERGLGRAPLQSAPPLVETPVDTLTPVDPNRRHSLQQDLDGAPPGHLIDVEA
jgi:hypothetical protein